MVAEIWELIATVGWSVLRIAADRLVWWLAVGCAVSVILNSMELRRHEGGVACFSATMNLGKPRRPGGVRRIQWLPARFFQQLLMAPWATTAA